MVKSTIAKRALTVLGAGFLWAAASGAAQAQQDTECVSSNKAWSVCTWNQPKECWGVSKPTQTVNTKDGKPTTVRRGDILMFVTFRPGGGDKGEISFTGGYPFAGGSTVRMAIDGSNYELFTDGEWAWTANPTENAKILAAMKRGSQAVLTARSAKGTQTQDTFSLQGFTAAMTEAEKRCG